jgi:ABC-type Fe3+/spermidine/putrescine transport system ATPase subunit
VAPEDRTLLDAAQSSALDREPARLDADPCVDAAGQVCALRVERVSKQFQGHRAVRDVSLTIRQGELITILGPSGCGKTTLLRLVAGLIDLDEGRIVLGERVIADPARRVNVPVEKRGVGLVFQDYALWPHLSVRQHLLFPLELQRVQRAQATKRVDELLRLVRLDGLGERLPGQLSGGQQQRVALARALAADAKLLLLDEPLSNLDARLRQAMREELQRLLRAAGMTAIAVTHDQADALAISDRVVVMSDGRVLQQGSPQEVFERPASSTVAHFLGSGSLVPGEIVGEVDGDGLAWFRPSASNASFQARASATDGPLVAIVPSAVSAADLAAGPLTALTGVVRSCQYAGGAWDLRVVLPGEHEVSLRSDRPATAGTAWTWSVPAQAIHLVLDDDPARRGHGATPNATT